MAAATSDRVASRAMGERADWLGAWKAAAPVTKRARSFIARLEEVLVARSRSRRSGRPALTSCTMSKRASRTSRHLSLSASQAPARCEGRSLAVAEVGREGGEGAGAVREAARAVSGVVSMMHRRRKRSPELALRAPSLGRNCLGGPGARIRGRFGQPGDGLNERILDVEHMLGPGAWT